mgnify:FL=1
MEKIDFINAKIDKKDLPGPHFLYKYRPFDCFALEMLENKYVYLCPAENLDDPSECKVDFSVYDYYQFETGQIKFKCVDIIMDSLIPFTSESNIQAAKELVYKTLTPDGLVSRNILLYQCFEIQELVPEIDIAPWINFLGNIPEKLDEPKIKERLRKLISLAYHARQDMGICSLSELNNSEEMWQNYGDGARGYCIEYDMRNYENTYALFPVVYQDNRQTNIAVNMIASFIGQMIEGISYNQIAADKSQFLRMFLTKDTKWEYQKEWRLIGDAKSKLSAPSVHSIYLGKNMSEQNKRQISDYCRTNNIVLHIEG